VKIKFLGATRQVTGSCYLLQAGGQNILVDCGLFQEREFLSRNWNPFPVPPREIDTLLLTHVHLDHSGRIPKLVKEGFRGTILCTHPTKEMFPVVLLDSARIQEEDAAYKKKRHKKEGRRGPHPEIPLYTVEDAENCLPLIRAVSYKDYVPLGGGVEVCFHDAGHILGSAMVEVVRKEKSKKSNIIFSGDIGQWDKPLVKDPSVFHKADYVVMESTYGDHIHEDPDKVDMRLCKVINDTVKSGGNIVIPTFAIERAQELMFHLSRLAYKDRIPYLMIFLDSPMAVDITKIFIKCKKYLDAESRDLFRRGRSPFDFPGLRLVQSVEASKAINQIRGSCVIMAGSGMVTGGRIKHHLIRNIYRPESTVLFVGYQAEGTLGRLILNGKSEVRIHGRHYRVKARIEQILGFSAHADKDDLARWLNHYQSPPKRVFLTHGEREATAALAEFIDGKGGWKVSVPEYLEEFRLDSE